MGSLHIKPVGQPSSQNTNDPSVRELFPDLGTSLNDVERIIQEIASLGWKTSTSSKSKFSLRENYDWIFDGKQIFDKCFASFFDPSKEGDLSWGWVDIPYKQNENYNLLKDWQLYRKINPSTGLPVRLILSSLSEDVATTTIGAYFTDKFGIWGATHAELQVGPLIFSWDDSEMCIPRSFTNCYALVVADLGFQVTQDHENLVTAMCNKVALWNKTMFYSALGYNSFVADMLCHGNCQVFVEDLLKVLGVTHTPKAKLEKYMQKLRGNKIQVPGITFKDHNNFDDYWYLYKNQYETDQFKLDEETLELFQAIDRAFTLREGRNYRCPYISYLRVAENYFAHESTMPSTTNYLEDDPQLTFMY